MKNRMLAVYLLGMLTGLVAFSTTPAFGDDKKPEITITSVPTDPPGENMASESVKGTVTGVNPAECKVVVYARGDKWYVQPTMAEPLISINGDGKWESETHGGTKFVALLVKPSYKPEANPGKIPAEGGNVLAVSKEKTPGK